MARLYYIIIRPTIDLNSRNKSSEKDFGLPKMQNGEK